MTGRQGPPDGRSLNLHHVGQATSARLVAAPLSRSADLGGHIVATNRARVFTCIACCQSTKVAKHPAPAQSLNEYDI